jgi:hypothetical protein
MLEGECDTFQFHTKCQVTKNQTKAISQNENQEPLKARVTPFGFTSKTEYQRQVTRITIFDLGKNAGF